MLKHGVQCCLARGLEQWLWFLGVDASKPERNLLERFGFIKKAPPSTGGSSLYELVWNGLLIELHSFCIGAYPNDADGFIYIRKHCKCFLYTASHTPCPGNYVDEDLTEPQMELELRSFHLVVSKFLNWLEEYELWIDHHYGMGYREACYKAYHLKWQPPTIGREWFKNYRQKADKVEPLIPMVMDMRFADSKNFIPTEHHSLQHKPVSPSVVKWPMSHSVI